MAKICYVSGVFCKVWRGICNFISFLPQQGKKHQTPSFMTVETNTWNLLKMYSLGIIYFTVYKQKNWTKLLFLFIFCLFKLNQFINNQNIYFFLSISVQNISAKTKHFLTCNKSPFLFSVFLMFLLGSLFQFPFVNWRIVSLLLISE